MLLLEKKYAPCTELQDFVESYQTYNTCAHGYNYMIPEGIIEIVFQIGTDVFQRKYKNSGIWQKRKQAFVGGLQDRAFQIRSRNIGKTFGIRFKVGGFAFFTKIPLHEFKNQFISFFDVWGYEGLDFQQQIIESEDIKTRIGLTELFLKKNYRVHRHSNLSKAFSILAPNEPGKSIQKLASDYSYSPSRFRQVFREVIGTSPKHFTMIRRIRNSFQKQTNTTSLTELAVELGYYDQSHFIHHCKRITGMCPRELYKQTLLTD